MYEEHTIVFNIISSAIRIYTYYSK